jgi:hypothetical protein
MRRGDRAEGGSGAPGSNGTMEWWRRPIGPTIPAFQCRGRRPAAGKPPMDCAEQSQFAGRGPWECGMRPWIGVQGEMTAECGMRTARAFVRNKAKVGRNGVFEGDRATWRGAVPRKGRTCQTRRPRQKSGWTEPIPGIGPETRARCRLGDFCHARQTKPISMRVSSLRFEVSGKKDARAKQSQFARGQRSGSGIGDRVADCAEQSRIWGEWDAWEKGHAVSDARQ